jgi:hypothetical protein
MLHSEYAELGMLERLLLFLIIAVLLVAMGHFVLHLRNSLQ